MISYDDIAYFYKDKDDNIVKNVPQGDSCNKLAQTFFYGKGEIDDVKYSIELKNRMMKGTLTELSAFKYFTEEEAAKLVLSGFIPVKLDEELVINPSQKWHLYVSYLAYQEINAELNISKKVKKVPSEKFKETKFSFGTKVKQKEYIKWIKKAANCNEDDSWDIIENVIENTKIKDNKK